MSVKTGNLAFELYNTKQKEMSGLKLAYSKLWIHVSVPDFLLIKASTLDTLIKSLIEVNPPVGRIVLGGDSNSMIFLVKKEDIRVHFKDINKLDEKTLKEYISTI